jgi:hypothetical protein
MCSYKKFELKDVYVGFLPIQQRHDNYLKFPMTITLINPMFNHGFTTKWI